MLTASIGARVGMTCRGEALALACPTNTPLVEPWKNSIVGLFGLYSFDGFAVALSDVSFLPNQ